MERKKFIHTFHCSKKTFWVYFCYMFFTNMILSMGIFPLFSKAMSLLSEQIGYATFSSGNYLYFFKHIQGILFFLVGILLCTLVLALHVNGYILLTNDIVHHDTIHLRDIFKKSFLSCKRYIDPKGIWFVLFMTLIFPLIDVGFHIFTVFDFSLPNFIKTPIMNHPILYYAYLVGMAYLAYYVLMRIFTLDYVLLQDTSIKDGKAKSRVFVKQNAMRLLSSFFINFVKFGALVFLIVFFTTIASVSIFYGLNLSLFEPNKYLTYLTMIMSVTLSYFKLTLVPISASILTKLFLEIEEGNTAPLEIQTRDRKPFIYVTCFAFLFTQMHTANQYIFEYQKIFENPHTVEIIAHRGAGIHKAENTLAGLQFAIDHNIKWAEIDVQRSKDGTYMLYHDNTVSKACHKFKRFTSMNSSDLQHCSVYNYYDVSQPVEPIPTMEEVLDLCKGKLNLFIELKGSSANQKMVDDLVKMIQEKQMEDQCVLVSLKEPLITYAHNTYPNIKTGFIYYFSIGNLKNIQADYLIMEEQVATIENIEKVHQADKKAIVWTVNNGYAANKYIDFGIDGIITDQVLNAKQLVDDEEEKDAVEKSIDFIERK